MVNALLSALVNLLFI